MSSIIQLADVQSSEHEHAMDLVNAGRYKYADWCRCCCWGCLQEDEFLESWGRELN